MPPDPPSKASRSRCAPPFHKSWIRACEGDDIVFIVDFPVHCKIEEKPIWGFYEASL